MIFARQIQSFAFATGLSVWLARRKRARGVIMFHGVDDVHMPAEAFETNLRWLAARFRIVSLGEIVDGMLAGRRPDPHGELALTFDDGLANHFNVAYPVLKRLGLPATFFVCPELIEGRRWIWNQEARARLQEMTAPARAEFARTNLATDTDGVEALVQRMKHLSLAERERAEADLRRRTPDFVASPLARRRFDPLTWDQLMQIDPALITIGSHSLSHPILPLIDDAALELEVAASRRMLEQRLDRRVDLFCYPNGAQDDRVHASVARNYLAAVTTNYGFVRSSDDAHRLMRIPAASSLPLMAWRMHWPNA
ncbi:MAG: polysaccharide deacetylase family protein [Betaproteobacteria bacterium]